MVERREKPINQPGSRAPQSLALFPGDEAAHQYFSERNDKENEIRKHIREKGTRETVLFLHLILMKLRQGEFS